MRHAIVEEENIPVETVTNFDEVIDSPRKQGKLSLTSCSWKRCEWAGVGLSYKKVLIQAKRSQELVMGGD